MGVHAALSLSLAAIVVPTAAPAAQDQGLASTALPDRPLPVADRAAATPLDSLVQPHIARAGGSRAQGRLHREGSLTNEPLLFRGTRMFVHLRSDQTGGAYALIEMHHPSAIGPALHVHPLGPESFLVLEGEYTFVRGPSTIVAHPGQAVTVPAGVPHRYVVGPAGGRVLVVTPPHLDQYFARVAARLAAGPVPLEEEFAIATEFGQDLLDREGHWRAADGNPPGMDDQRTEIARGQP